MADRELRRLAWDFGKKIQTMTNYRSNSELQEEAADAIEKLIDARIDAKLAAKHRERLND